MIGAGNNKKSMAYVENIAAFIQHIASVSSGIHVVNYIDKPDFSMNELTNIICTSLGKKTNNIRIPFLLA